MGSGRQRGTSGLVHDVTFGVSIAFSFCEQTSMKLAGATQKKLILA